MSIGVGMGIVMKYTVIWIVFETPRLGPRQGLGGVIHKYTTGAGLRVDLGVGLRVDLGVGSAIGIIRIPTDVLPYTQRVNPNTKLGMCT